MAALSDLYPTLPRPLALLASQACRGSPEARHGYAKDLLEATLKLAAAAQIGGYVAAGRGSAGIDQRLEALVLPSTGHWLWYLDSISMHLAGRMDADLIPLSRVALSLKRKRKDLPDCAKFIAAATEAIRPVGSAPTEFTLLEFFSVFVEYRNKAWAHAETKPAQFYERMAQSMAAAAAEVLSRHLPELLAGMRLAVPRLEVSADRTEPHLEWLDLTGLYPARMEVHLTGVRDVVAGRPYLVGDGIVVALFPVVAARRNEQGMEEIGFLNRVVEKDTREQKEIRAVEYPEPYTGKPMSGIDAAAAVAELLSRVRGKTVGTDDVSVMQLEQPVNPEEWLELDSTPGRMIGEFALMDRLGRGGMGVVYRARQRSTRRPVALKVLYPSLAVDPEAIARFHRETKALAACRHPNVVQVYDAGFDNHHHYLAMELVDGADLAGVCRTLSDWSATSPDLREGHLSAAVSSSPAGAPASEASATPAEPQPAPPEISGGQVYFIRLAELVAGAADGLAHLHEHGIIHRDIKPGNLMVTTDIHRAVVMDLGLAHIENSESVVLSEEDHLLGTPRFIAPEQIPPREPADRPADRLSDIYSLGATLYELACLRALYEGDREAVLEAKKREDPLRPRLANPRVPLLLEAIIEKAIARRPERRYASAALMAEDLRAFAAGRPLPHARPRGRLARAHNALRRGWRGVAVAAAAVALAAVAYGVWASAETRKTDVLRSRVLAAVAEYDKSNDEPKSLALMAFLMRRDTRNLEVANQIVKRLSDRNWMAHPDGVVSVQFSPDGMRLLTTCRDGNARVWDALSRRPVGKPMPHGDGLTCAVYSPDGKQILTAGWDREVRFWDAATGERRPGEITAIYPVNSITFSPDGRLLALGEGARGSNSGWIDVFAVDKLVMHQSFQLAPTNSVVFHPRGDRLLAASDDGTARILWLDNAARPPVVFRHRVKVNSAVFGPEGEEVATASDDATVQLWDAATGKRKGDPIAHRGPVRAVAISPDGTQVASASDGGAILWEKGGGKRDLLRDTSVKHVVFSGDGLRLATGGWDLNARLWYALDATPVIEPERSYYLDEEDRLASPLGGVERFVWPGAARTLAALADSVALRTVSDPERLNVTLAPASGSFQVPRSGWLGLDAGAFSRFVRWYVAEPGTRTLGPYHKDLSRREAEAFAGRDDEASVGSAYRLNPDSTLVLAKLANTTLARGITTVIEAGANPTPDKSRDLERLFGRANFLIRYALARSGSNPDVLFQAGLFNETCADFGAFAPHGSFDVIAFRKGAADRFRTAADQRPENSWFWQSSATAESKFASALWDAGRRAEAREADQRAFEAARKSLSLEEKRFAADPNASSRRALTMALSNLSWYHSLANRAAEAISTVRRGMELDSTNSFLWENLANGYLLAGDFARASEILLKHKDDKLADEGPYRLSEKGTLVAGPWFLKDALLRDLGELRRRGLDRAEFGKAESLVRSGAGGPKVSR